MDNKKHKPPQIKKKKIGALQQQLQQVSGSSSGCITETSVGPASVMVGNLVQGNRLAIAQGRDVGFSDDTERKVSIFLFFLIFFLLKFVFFLFNFNKIASADNRSTSLES